MIDTTIKAALCAGAVLTVTAGVAWFSHHEREIGRAEVRAEWEKAKAAQNGVVLTRAADVATINQQQAAKTEEVDNHAQAQIAIIVADRDRAVSSVTSLRNTLDRVRADAMSGASDRARLAAQIAAASNGLGECSSRYSAVAESLDRLSVQVSGLLELVPEIRE